jgi:7-carboxy-7-deazaguanine synthase
MNTTGSTSPSRPTKSDDSDVTIAQQLEESPSSSTPTNEASGKKFPVIEIFGPVIQGEGSQAGQQTMFIRFGGCDYRCQKCDSMHAVMPQAVQKHATYMDWKEIVRKLEEAYQQTGVKWVTFSGGNPCMHKLDDLVDQLVYNGWYINVETQGTLWQDWVAKCTMVTVSPKSMGMGEKFEAEKFRKFLAKIGPSRPVCIKVVVFSAQDFEFALHVKGVAEGVSGPGHPLFAYYLSLGNPYPPILDDDLNLIDSPSIAALNQYSGMGLPNKLLKQYRELSEEVLQDPRLKDFRFLPQLHVLVYGNESER